MSDTYELIYRIALSCHRRQTLMWGGDLAVALSKAGIVSRQGRRYQARARGIYTVISKAAQYAWREYGRDGHRTVALVFVDSSGGYAYRK